MTICATATFSLLEPLRRRAEEEPRRTAFTFLDSEGAEAEALTWGELDERARVVAAALQEIGAEGEPVLLLQPPGLAFITSFLGCLYAGAIAVPAYPPGRNRPATRLRSIAGDSGARAVLAPAALAAGAALLAERAPELAGARWIATDALDSGLAGAWRERAPSPGDPAFLQYTSGSTAEPKGVVVTHGSLLDNEEAIRLAFGQSATSVVVGWLPLYHDMGLIGNVLQPLYTGARAVLMSPLAFLQRPASWLQAISRYRATTSGGPNFAYDLCLRKVSEAEKAELDLASWRVAFNGSEPVRAETLERFAAAFAGCGFREQAFFPCYGLAEATLFVTGGTPEEPPVVRSVDAAALERHRAVEAPPGAAGSRALVGCGRAALGQTVRIVDPETRVASPPGQVGEIWVAGPSVAAGYWRRPEETRSVFAARLADGEGPYLRTGDLGFLAEGELFVTGRRKDLIIVRGRNHYPQDLERTAEASHPALRPGCGAAFAVEREGEERVVLVQEVERAGDADLGAAAEAVRRALAEEHEIAADEVVLIRRGTILKTTSGKIRRAACRAAYLAGELAVAARTAAGQARGEEQVREELGRVIARILRRDPSEIDPDVPLLALGLDSLAAAELRSAVEERAGVAVALSALLEGMTLRGLEAAVRAVPETPLPPASLPSPDLPGEHPLSEGQRALWFLDRLDPAAAACHLAGAARVRAGLDAAALRRALVLLADRHPALRTTFEARSGEPVRRVHARLEPDFAVAAADEAALPDLLVEEAYRPFDLERGPLLRLRVFTLREGGAALLLAVHHLVADFASAAVLARDLLALYAQERGGPTAGLPPPGPGYTAWLRREEEALAGPRGERLRAWWHERLAGELPVLELPADRPRSAARSWRGHARTVRLEGAGGALRSLARSQGVTLYATLLAALQAVLHRWTGEREALVGAPAAGRHPAWAGEVGYFVRPVPLRLALDGEPSFAALAARAGAAAAAAFEHGDYPFPRLARELRLDRDAGRSLLRAMLVLQPSRSPEERALAPFALGEEGALADLGGLVCESLALPEVRAMLDLLLMAAEFDGALALSLQLDADLFDPATADRLLGHLGNFLRAAAADPARPVAAIEVLSPAERRQIAAWSAGPPVAPAELCLHELIAAQAARTPEAVALAFGDERLSYRELLRRAGRLADRLRRLGVGPEIRVGVCARRTPDLVVGLLAVLEAGGAYVPLDPAYPAERLSLLLEDSGAALLLTDAAGDERLPSGGPPRTHLDSLPEASETSATSTYGPLPENLAYLIYTSGSTGRPKAVAVEHRSAVALARWAREAFSPRELGGVLAATSIGFDLSVFELFVPLCWGGRVVLAGSVLDLPEIPAAAGVRLVNTVPSAMAELLQAGGLPAGVETVNLAGEPLRRELTQALFAAGARRVVNLYGPSEDTTYSTIADQERDGGDPPIGRPVAGTRALALDAAMRPVPAGVVGELYLAGAGLARGYLGRPELTAERFVPSPFAADGPGARLYRTGDRVRWRGDGELLFLGRSDHQVKVRGFRIEPGEIEAALAEHPAVREAVVVAREKDSGEKGLAAYVVPAQGGGAEPNAAALRSFLAARLPEYMVPSAFVALPVLPLTPNGKVDRKALAGLAPAAAERSAGRPPATPVEAVLAAIWTEVLGCAEIGAEEDFFELGGHSLLAVRAQARVRERLGIDLPLPAVFRAPTVARLAAEIEALRAVGAAAAPPIVPVPRDGPLPASFAQERLWFIDRMGAAPDGRDRAAYNMPLALELAGALDAAALAAALTAIVRRHEALRTTLAAADGGVFQEIAPPRPLRLPLVDLSRLARTASDGAEAEARRLAHAEELRPFDLARGPLLRVALVRLAARRHLLLATVHHAVADGWSLGVFLDELAALYRPGGGGPAAADAGADPPLLPVQYADYAVWQRRRLSGPALAAALAFWRARLEGLPELLELPADRSRPSAASFRGGRLRRALPAGLAPALHLLGRRQGTTLFMTLLAGMQALLARLSGREDIPVGTPVAGRGRPELEGLIGLFVNTLVLRGDLAGRPTGAELLARVREAALAAWAHQELPFEKLVEELAPRRARSHSPLFQALLAVQDLPRAPLRLPELELRPLPAATGVETTAKFDLALTCVETPAGLDVEAEFARDLFDPPTVTRLVGHFATLLAGLAAAPGRPVAELPLLSPAERHQLLAEWNATAAAFPRDASIGDLFSAQARERPQAVALIWEGGSLTYAELEARANRLARRLVRLGVRLETLVGVALERSPERVAALLAILKAGGAYLPLDPDYPPARLAVMAEDALAGQDEFVVLTRGETAGRLPRLSTGGRLLPFCVDGEDLAAESAAPPPVPVGGRNLAYVLYTSGSTGRPKGVAVEHRSVVRLVRGAGCCRFGPEEVFLHLAPLPFDASTLEIWGPLLNGGRLALLPPGRRSLEELGAAIARYGVTTLWLTAGLFHQMVETQLPALLGVRQLLAGGDVLSPVHVERVLAARRERRGAARAALVNGYGPTENTTFTCCHRLEPEERLAGSVPIGRPIANTRVYLLDRNLEAVPAAVPGELYCGGDGLARGYLHRPDWTAERFVPDPFGRGERLYRTGDLARWRPDGSLEFLGRRDGQVKLRGFRVETGEVEAALAAHPAVAQAAVVARPEPGGERRLVAYVVPAAGAGAPEALRGALRAELARRLPGYMLPAAWVTLQALPLTPNGKVDRAALPEPEPAAPAAELRAPLTPLEELLAEVWAEVLGRPRVAADESFFDLGGHSLLATRAVSRLRERLGIELPLHALFDEPTVAGLARRLDVLRGAGGPPAPPVVPVPRDRPLPASFGQERLWFMDRLDPGSPVYNMPAAVSLRGALQPERLRAAVEAVAARHEALRTAFPAPAGTPVQRIAPRLALRLPAVDLSGLAPEARRAEVRRLSAAEALRPFDLESGPLLRTTLLRLQTATGADEHVLLLTVHHIVFDGWSRGIFLRELAAFYGGTRAAEEPPFPPLPVQYADFAVWQRRRATEEALAPSLAWWRERLAGAPPALPLPFDRPRPPVQTFRGGSLRLALRPEASRAARELGRRLAATPFMVFLAAWSALLARLTGEEDLVVGTAAAGRDRPETEPLIGLFAGNLALRVDLAGDPPFADLLARVRETVLSSWAHREVPFERLVQELRPERDLSRAPLYQAVLALDASEHPPLALPGLRLAVLPVETGTAKFDLGLYLDDRRGEVTGLLEYNRDLFDAATAARLLAAFERLVEAATDAPERRLAELPVLSAAERQQVEVELPAVARTDAPALVPRRIEARAAAHPEAPAVTGGGRTLSFGELDRRAGALARTLRAHGVGPEARVAVCLDRSPELLVALLGIWKAGGVYVPLDPAHPEERLAWIVADAAAAAVLASRRGPAPPAGAPVLWLDEQPEEPAAELTPTPLLPAAAAYLIYTSGSTGRPKGVVVPHEALAAYAAMAADLYAVGPGDRVLQSASPGFDLSLDEIVPCLTGGAELVLREDAMLASPVAFLDGCRAHGITVLSLPTALWHDIAAHVEAEPPAPLPALRLLVLGGERLLPERLAAWRRRFPDRPRLLNTYGPTEGTILVTAADLTAPEEPPRVEAPIGRPVQGAEVWLLGRWGEPVPLGVAGEIAIGGSFVARGYLDRPEQTAERFVPHPFPRAAGARLYRTGDLARRLPDGRLEFAGRVDAQVKVRGYRVEPGEVERVLARHPGVQSAAVVARAGEPGRARLVAYLVPRQPAPAAAEVRAFLASSLPEPLVPSDFVFLDALPLTAHGKVDRGALPDPGPRAAAEHVAPRDETERAIAALWREALGVERVGVDDNFFDLGGHSLALARVHVLLHERLGREIPIIDLFRHPTVASLARRLALPAEAAAAPVPQVRERAERSRAATRQGRFLEARKRMPARPAAPPAAVDPAPLPSTPLWDRASEAAHAGLSRASAAFLRFAEAHPECRERTSFSALAEHAAGSPYPLQPWPALVDRRRVAEMERVSTGLVRLVKSLPRRAFGGDPERLRAFYGLPSAELARSLIAEPNGLEGAVGRGDFLDSAAGLRCLELNLVSDLGGWQAPLWAEGYLRVPVFQRFLREEGVRVACRDTVALLFAHVAAEARELGAADGEVNVALVPPEDGAATARGLLPWLAGRYAAALREAAPGAGGTLLLLPYSALRERGGRLWADGRPVHAAVEVHHEGTAAQAFRCFKAGTLKLYNAPIRSLLTDKRNLALLSELADGGPAPAGAALEPEERTLVARHLPWTRRLAAAEASWRGREVWLPELVLAAREELVIKRAREGRGEAVHLGAATPAGAWKERVARALAEGDWIVQERVEPLPYVHQLGERGCGPHDVVWGLFVFGGRYGGGFLSLAPRAARAEAPGGVVNLTRGASAGVVFEVLDDV